MTLRTMPSDLMAYIVLTLVALVALADQFAPYYGEPDTTCRVGFVYDGDTVEMICAGQSLRARLQGFDTPETKDPKCPSEAAWGSRATARMRHLVKQPGITLYRHGHDKYGRDLVVMHLNNRDAAEIMIGEGLAVPYEGGQRRSWCE